MDSRIVNLLLLVLGIILSILALYPSIHRYFDAILGLIIIIIALVGLWRGKVLGLGN
jgi:hypothetical protein